MAKQNLQIWIMRHDNLAKAVALGVVVVVLLFLVWIPSLEKISKLQNKIFTRSKEEEKLAQKMTVVSDLDAEALKERVKILDRALPPQKDVVLYLATIDGLSRELGLSFAGISLSPGDVTEASESAKTKKIIQPKGVQTLETEIKINGNRDKIYEFLKALEKTSPLMQIKDVQVSSLGLGSENYLLSLKLGMLFASREMTKLTGVVTLFNEKEEAYFQQLVNLRRFDNPFVSQTNSLDGLGKYNLFSATLQQ